MSVDRAPVSMLLFVMLMNTAIIALQCRNYQCKRENFLGIGKFESYFCQTFERQNASPTLSPITSNDLLRAGGSVFFLVKIGLADGREEP